LYDFGTLLGILHTLYSEGSTGNGLDSENWDQTSQLSNIQLIRGFRPI